MGAVVVGRVVEAAVAGIERTKSLSGNAGF
jgi:hypothetical protein